jgi:hypothetical protein
MDYYTGATNKARLPIGTAGQVLKVNAGATAPEWGNSGLALIEEKLLADVAANFDFTGIPAIYRSLKLILHARSNRNATADSCLLTFNGDSAAHYDYRYMLTDASGSSVSAPPTQAQNNIFIGNISGLTATSGMAGSVEIKIPNYSGTVFRKNLIGNNFLEIAESGLNASLTVAVIGGHWRSSSAINQITISLSSGSFIAGSIVSLYGMI